LSEAISIAVCSATQYLGLKLRKAIDTNNDIEHSLGI